MKTRWELMGLPTREKQVYEGAVTDARREVEGLRRKPGRGRALAHEDLVWNAALDEVLRRIALQPGCPHPGEKCAPAIS